MTTADDLPGTTGTVYYTKDSPNEELYSYVYKDAAGANSTEKQQAGSPFTNLERIETQVQVRDLRPIADSFSLEKNGFVLRSLRVPNDIDWTNKEDVSPSKAVPLMYFWKKNQ